MSADALRLFAAAAVPREHLQWVAERTQQLRTLWPEARWAPIENQHVTLRFLGSTRLELLGDVRRVCRDAAASVDPTDVELGGLGVFPSVRRARVLWVGVADPAGALTRLAGSLEAGLEPLGFAPEKRSFSPHLTLARFKRPRRLDALPALVEPPGPFLLDSFGLWRSHLSPRGARYELLDSFPLTAVGSG